MSSFTKQLHITTRSRVQLCHLEGGGEQCAVDFHLILKTTRKVVFFIAEGSKALRGLEWVDLARSCTLWDI